MMVAPFEEAVHKLKPGQISAPVRTQFGWHIIKLNDVREAGTPEERQQKRRPSIPVPTKSATGDHQPPARTAQQLLR